MGAAEVEALLFGRPKPSCALSLCALSLLCRHRNPMHNAKKPRIVTRISTDHDAGLSPKIVRRRPTLP
ncbi:hypothetical protein, partial [Streptomyces xanthochromogenes]|uniref:hypothetical protein n=1 Tax=Streptomyces xanthochromogenes TaxID=67384 RepID=UPI0033340453